MRLCGGTVLGHFEAARKFTPPFALLSQTGACAQQLVYELLGCVADSSLELQSDVATIRIKALVENSPCQSGSHVGLSHALIRLSSASLLRDS